MFGPFARGILTSLVCSVALFAIAASAAEVRGVTDSEIVIGTITDLSGVTAVQGVNNSDAIRLEIGRAHV